MSVLRSSRLARSPSDTSDWRVASEPRSDQGVADALAKAFRPEELPGDLARLLARLR